ncbi:unnamed protein product [Amoebophrya sp. A120]|nr:unnamed protein product [Amoebophrya sp. A120]|eukprot:GSA120T00009350001.1
MSSGATPKSQLPSATAGYETTVGHRADSKKVIFPIDSVAFLGAGMSIGQNLRGLEVAPQAVRAAHLASLVKKLGYTWKDYGDVDFDALFREKGLAAGTSASEQNTIALAQKMAEEDELFQKKNTITRENFDTWRNTPGIRAKISFGDWLLEQGLLDAAHTSSGTASEAEDITPTTTKSTMQSPISTNPGVTPTGAANQNHPTVLAASCGHRNPSPAGSNGVEKPIKNLDLIGPACEHLYQEILRIHRKTTTSMMSADNMNSGNGGTVGAAPMPTASLFQQQAGEQQISNIPGPHATALTSKLKIPRPFQLTVGGDHAVAVSTITAMQQIYPDLCVIWVDAHGDCNTPKTSPSGHYHGMPAAHVMGWFDSHPKGFETWMPENCKPVVNAHNFCFIGLRDIDPGEAELMRNSDLHFFTMRDVDELGIANVIKEALRRIDPNARRPIHLSFDIDGCDPSIAPGTGTCARGGLTYREAHYICEELALTRRLVSMDLVEINPVIDTLSDYSKKLKMHGDLDVLIGKHVSPTVRLGTELVLSALGQATMYRK